MKFQNQIFTLLLTAFLMGCGMSAEPPFVDEEETEKPLDLTILDKCEPGAYLQRWQTPAGEHLELAVEIPKNYSDAVPSPLVVVLHYGVTDESKPLGKIVIDELVKPAAGTLSPILLAPRLINQSWLDPACSSAVVALVEKFMATYNIDRQSVLIVGYGIGATGVWQFVNEYPNLFQAGIAVAGSFPDAAKGMKTEATIFAIHSKNDQLFPYSSVATAVRQLQADGNPNVELITTDAESHYFINDFIPPLKDAFERIAADSKSPSGESP